MLIRGPSEAGFGPSSDCCRISIANPFGDGKRLLAHRRTATDYLASTSAIGTSTPDYDAKRRHKHLPMFGHRRAWSTVVPSLKRGMRLTAPSKGRVTALRRLPDSYSLPTYSYVFSSASTRADGIKRLALQSYVSGAQQRSILTEQNATSSFCSRDRPAYRMSSLIYHHRVINLSPRVRPIRITP